MLQTPNCSYTYFNNKLLHQDQEPGKSNQLLFAPVFSIKTLVGIIYNIYIAELKLFMVVHQFLSGFWSVLVLYSKY